MASSISLARTDNLWLGQLEGLHIRAPKLKAVSGECMNEWTNIAMPKTSSFKFDSSLLSLEHWSKILANFSQLTCSSFVDENQVENKRLGKLQNTSTFATPNSIKHSMYRLCAIDHISFQHRSPTTQGDLCRGTPGVMSEKRGFCCHNCRLSPSAEIVLTLMHMIMLTHMMLMTLVNILQYLNINNRKPKPFHKIDW